MSYIGNSPISVAFLTDTFSGTGSQTAFTMSIAPANTSSCLVVVSGVTQDPSTYSVSGTTLTFSAAPPSGTSNISVRYLGIPASGVTTTAYRTVTDFTATAAQTSFSVPSYTVGYIDVYRNGVRLVSTDFTATTGTTVVLANACTSGDAVVTESFYVSSVLNAIPATAGSVSSSNLAALSTIPSTAGNITVPAVTGTMMVSGNMPAFSAISISTQTVSNNTWTKVILGSEEYDTNNNFASSTFTPTVAGYYQLNCVIRVSAGTNYTTAIIGIYKNGNEFRRLQQLNGVTSTANGNIVGSYLVSANGSTDYFELYGYIAGTGTLQFLNDGTPYTPAFSGYLARAA